ncbi:cupin domain-containing protein [Pseudofrankia inefficax]|uniref:Cupin 2 conserved barrel domain protein n=1 Tax=Pseudofrankia inefficax (strain DSM 45817 / CECT 9037 / DDB 130130 / EuI1c) TaxID=298654 RepID=E3J3P1_PSEI1|nr:cupin domain-containing protein [Pseudofrankia inefficax]ADP79378.1 Cupin 2 conserved barrel domain protein [Pseudofrankia inefficax]
MTGTPGKVVVRDQIPPVRWAAEQGRFLLRATDTGGRFSLLELTTPPGGGPPAHQHRTVDEALIVTSGRYEIRLGGRVVLATPGTVVYGPRGLPHGFRNIGAEPGTILCIASPGGVESMFEELAELSRSDGPRDRRRLAELMARHDVEYV